MKNTDTGQQRFSKAEYRYQHKKKKAAAGAGMPRLILQFSVNKQNFTCNGGWLCYRKVNKEVAIMTINQLINLFNQPINPSTYITFTDILFKQYPKQEGEEDSEYLHNLYTYFQKQNSLLLISGETGEVINEIPIKNYNNQKFGTINNTNFQISTN